MSKDDQKFIQKQLLIFCGTLTAFMCIFLYLGGDFMENCVCDKIIKSFSVILIILISLIFLVMCIFGIIAVFNCDYKKSINSTIACPLDKDSGAVLTHKKSDSSETYSWYKNAEDAFKNARNGDTIFILDKEWNISEEKLINKDDKKLSLEICGNITKVKVTEE